MKYMWAVCDVEADGKYYAYPIRISVADNLLSKLTINGIKTANLCESKKMAKEVADMWNGCHKTNNEYMFTTDDPTF